VNTFQALRVLNIDSSSSQNEIKAAYRKMALELHPDKNNGKSEDDEFKKITEAYNHLKNNHNQRTNSRYEETTHDKPKNDFKRKPQWGAPDDGSIPEQDWGKYTREFEEDYNARVRADGRNGEFEKAQEPKKQPDLFVDVDKSLCIGCCSCEIIAPDVFSINKESRSNPKSSVINQKGAGINKIMNAAETCPTKAIRVDNVETKERLYPY
jgi:DnaJ-class molecular chaperone